MKPQAPKPQPSRAPYMVSDVAKRLNVTVDHVYDLIEEGELHAIDVAGKGASRRLFRIPAESLTAFLKKRGTVNPSPMQTPARNPIATAKQ